MSFEIISANALVYGLRFRMPTTGFYFEPSHHRAYAANKLPQFYQQLFHGLSPSYVPTLPRFCLPLKIISTTHT